MIYIIRMPVVNVNDESAELVRWVIADSAKVYRGDVICAIETSKSAIDIIAEEDGYLREFAQPGSQYKVGETLGFITPLPDTPLPNIPNSNSTKISNNTSGLWTKKAKILADRLGVDLDKLSKSFPSTAINEALVLEAANQKNQERAKDEESNGSAKPVIQKPNNFNSPECIGLAPSVGLERVLILGAGGGAALVLDILSRTTSQKAIGILDNNPQLHGESLMGVPVLGSFDLITSLWERRAFDSVISTVVRDIQDRARIFETYTSAGIPFTNVIDPSVRIGTEATIGSGNLIIYGSYIATCTSIGNNNFLAAGTIIEHHSSIGDHCTFGPRCALSGKVSIGNQVKLGTYVAVEPELEVGDCSVIASGITLTTNIPSKSIVKTVNVPAVRSVAS